MANDRGGAVDAGTEMMSWGAQQMEEGWAMSAGAGQPANVQDNLMRAAQKRGSEAAEAIRQRYFKKEFDTVQDVHAAKIYAEMEAAQQAYEFETKIEIGAIQTIQSAQAATQENIDLQNQVSMGTDMQDPGVISNPPGVKDGVNPMPQPSEPPPAPDGGVITEQGESFLLPDGRRIGITTAEGFMHAQSAAMRVGEAVKIGTLALKDLAAKYTGNPYFDNWSEEIDNSLIGASNAAATGTRDPHAAMEKYQNFQKRDADITAAQDEHQADVFSQDTRQAMRDQGAEEATQRARTDPNYGGNVSASLLQKMRNPNAVLTQKEAARANVGLQAWKADKEREIAAAKASGMFKFSSQQLAVPENVPAYMAGDKRRGQLYGQHRLEASGAAAEIARADIQAGGKTSEAMEDKLRALGAETVDIIEFREGQTSENMQEVMEKYVESDPDLYRRANGRADVERLTEIMRQQPQAVAMVDAEVEGYIQRHPEFTDKQVDKIRANKANYFIRITQGYDPGYTSAMTRQAGRQIDERYTAPEPDIDGPLAREPLSSNASQEDQSAYNLGLPSAPTRNFPRISHRSDSMPMSRSDTGSSSLVERAMSGRSFSSGPRPVSDLDMIAKAAADHRNAGRVARASGQGGQTLDSFAEGVSAEGMTAPVAQVGRKVRTRAGQRRNRRAATGE